MPSERERRLIDQEAYDLQIALTDAIERYLAELRRTQYRALTYRGADLGRAIAIELYFRLVNDSQLRAAYGRYLAGDPIEQDVDEIPLSAVAYWIFRQILHRPPPGYLHRQLKAYVKLSYAMGKSHIAGTNCDMALPPNDLVLILALSKRFFDYLMPVKRALNVQTRWLVPADSDWIAEPAANGETFIPFGAEPAKTPIGPLTEPLAAHWAGLTARFDEFRKILERERPMAVVVTEGNQTNDEIIARAARSVGVRSICVQQGWSPIIHAGFRGMRYDLFCAWGPAFAELLRPYNPDQAFAATGSHCIGPSVPRQGCEMAVSFFLQKNSLLITDRAWNEMLAFILWVAKSWPEQQILVREHPAEPLTESEKTLLAGAANITLCPSSLTSLDDVLRQTGIAVAFYSTTLIEALANLAVPLIINITGAPHYSPDLASLGAGLEVHDFGAAREAISRLLSGEANDYKKRIPAISARFFSHPTETALKNIVAAIIPRPVAP